MFVVPVAPWTELRETISFLSLPCTYLAQALHICSDGPVPLQIINLDLDLELNFQIAVFVHLFGLQL